MAHMVSAVHLFIGLCDPLPKRCCKRQRKKSNSEYEGVCVTSDLTLALPPSVSSMIYLAIS